MAKALAIMIEAATVAIIERVPESYMKYDATGKLIQ